MAQQQLQAQQLPQQVFHQQVGEPVEMEDAGQAPVQQLLQLRLEQGELGCPDLHNSFFTKKGVIMSIINSNCTGSTSVIGGLRLGVAEIEKMPAYIDRNRDRIKHVAVEMLDRHIKLNQCATGMGESLALEDYGISFSLATLAPRSQGYNPTKRVEAPLYYCLFPGLIEPAYLGSHPDGTADYAHIINVFIHLLPATQRRIALLKKLDREAAVAMPVLQPAVPMGTPAPVGKRARQLPIPPFGGNGGQRGPTPWEVTQNQVVMQANRIVRLEQELQNARSRALPSPPLPAPGAPPIWRQGGQVDLPDDL